MNRRVENVQVESRVEAVFAPFDSRTCDRRGGEAEHWESGLTDFEWIDFWASLYSGGEVATIKH